MLVRYPRKIKILNAGGGLPTEIVGFDTTGKYLIGKQPQAYPYRDYFEDLEAAKEAMCGIHPSGGKLRGRTIVTWVDGRPWAISDLHKGNIMRDSSDRPVIIDALLGKVTPEAQKRMPWLKDACLNARTYRNSGCKPLDPFEDIDDSDL